LEDGQAQDEFGISNGGESDLNEKKPQLAEFMTYLEQQTMHRDKEDIWLSRDTKNKTYIIKSSYKKLTNPRVGDNPELFNMSWNLKVLSSAQFFARRVALNKVTTKQNLSKRGVQLSHATCVFYGRVEESTPHLFITC